MQELAKTLQSTLEKSGFCYDTLKQLENSCAQVLRDPELSASNRVAVFVLLRICFSIAERLDDETSTPVHQRLQDALLLPLKRAVDSLTADNVDEKLAALDEIIRAYLSS